MNYVGIDFSLNAPSVCVLDEKNELTFFSIMRDEQTKIVHNAIQYLNDFYPIFNVVMFNTLKNKIYSDTQIDRIIDAKLLIFKIIEFIKINTNTNINTIIGIEGFSYGSTGNRLIEIAGYSYLLRYLLQENNYEYKIFSPKTIKKNAGSGKFSKLEMIEHFLNSSELSIKIKNIVNSDEFKKNINIRDKWLKPFEDMVDAYWTMLTVKNNLKN